MLWNVKEERMKPRVHIRSPKEQARIIVEAAVSLATRQENRGLPRERAKDICLPTEEIAQRVPEELRLLVF